MENAWFAGDSNSSPEEIFKKNEWKDVLKNRMAVIQSSLEYPLYGATNLIRKINALPPLKFDKEEEERIDIRL